MSAIEIKEVVQAAICESTVDFRPVDRYITVGKFHSDVFAGVVIVMEFYLNSCTGESARELIPRLTAINRLTDPLLKYRNFVLVFLFQRRVCESVFVLDSLYNTVAAPEIVALVDCLAFLRCAYYDKPAFRLQKLVYINFIISGLEIFKSKGIRISLAPLVSHWQAS